MPHEDSSLNTLHIVLNASPVVQAVLLCLATFSVFSWAIIFAKWRIFRSSFRKSENFLDIFWSGKSMDHIYTESKKFSASPIARIFQSGYVELQRLLDRERKKPQAPESKGIKPPDDSSIFNLERALGRAFRSELLRLERSLSFLATTGSTAPFIGLFGTVWGIMVAFQQIGIQGNASLATVAPGIAEALIATAVGLACAIPAVMGYNYYIHKVKATRTQMENFSGDFLNIVKRNFLSA